MIATLDELFRGLAGSGADYLVAGATALTLHGVPRLTGDVDLLVEPSAENLGRVRRRLLEWGFGERRDGEVLRFTHSSSPVAEVDVFPPPPAEYAALRGRAVTLLLADVPIPVVSRDDLRLRKETSGRPEDLQDAEGLRILEEVERGAGGAPEDLRRTQIVKFRRWHTENRCEWLLAGMRLARGLPPDVRPDRGGRFRDAKLWRGRRL